MTQAAGRVTGRCAGVLALLAVLLLIVSPVPAWAHSELARSDPPNGGMVAIGRTSLSLWYSEPVDVGASEFELRTRDGEVVDVRTEAPDGGVGTLFELSSEPLKEGIYVLHWTIRAATDGHLAAGSVVFGAGVRPEGVPGAATDFPSGGNLLLRWLDLGTLLLAVGALAVSGRVLGAVGELSNTLTRRARRRGAVAAGLAAAFGAATPFVRTPRGAGTVGEWWDATVLTLTESTWGHTWLVREAMLLLATFALVRLVVRRDPARAEVAFAGVALVGAVLAEAWAGHAASLASHSGQAVVVSAFHLVAAGVWLGGLVVLVLTLASALRLAPEARRWMTTMALRRFGPMAAAAVGVLVLSGLYMSARQISGLRSLETTLYGRTVLAKVVILVAALALATGSALIVDRRLPGRLRQALGRPVEWVPVRPARLPALVTAEVCVLFAAVGAAAVLTTTTTARADAAGTGSTAVRSENVDGLLVTFEAVPGGPSRTKLIVRARSTVKPEPAPIVGVTVRFVAPSGIEESASLRLVEPGRYETDVVADTPGNRQAWVAVQRPPRPDAVMQVSWVVASSAVPETDALDVLLTALGILLLAALAGALGQTPRRRDSAEPAEAWAFADIPTGR